MLDNTTDLAELSGKTGQLKIQILAEGEQLFGFSVQFKAN